MGNTLVLLVYGSRFRQSATRTFVLFMATLDLITNVLGLPLQTATVRHAYDDNYWRCRLFFAFSTLSTQPSGFMLVLVALDRFSRICTPLRKQLNPRQALYVASGTVCCALVVFAPFIPYYGIQRINTTVPGLQARMCWSEDEYKHGVYPIAYKFVVGIVFFLGLAIMVASYISIGFKLWWKKVVKKRSLKLMREQQNQNAPQAAVPCAAVTSVTHPSESGQPGLHQSLEVRLTSNPGAAIPAEMSDTFFFDSTSTDDCLSASTTSCPEATVMRRPGQTELDAAADGDDSQGECCGDGKSPAAQSHDKRSSTVEKRKTMVRSSTVHKGIRRMRSRTTLMMAVLTIFYIINWLPHLVMRAIRNDPVNWCHNFTDCGSNTYGVVIRSYYLNSAVNAFVYSFCNERFRQECRIFVHGIVRKLSRRGEEPARMQLGRHLKTPNTRQS